MLGGSAAAEPNRYCYCDGCCHDCPLEHTKKVWHIYKMGAHIYLILIT